jgi:outer membrane protein assembly factor BamB
MQRVPFPTSFIFGLIPLLLLSLSVFGQKKPFAEVDPTKCWSYSLEGTTGLQITSDDSRILIASGDGRIEAVAYDGKKIWSSEFGGEISSNILAAADSLFFVTSTLSRDNAKSADSRLRSVSKETGITNWTVPLRSSEEYFLSSFNNGIIIVSKSGDLQSIEKRQGGVKWKREIPEGIVADPQFTTAEIIVATAGNRILSVAMATGQIDWVGKTAFGTTALTVFAKDVFIVGDERGNLFSMPGLDKPFWSFKTGGRISNILPAGDYILAASDDNFVYFLTGRNGSRAWKKRLPGRVARMTKIQDQYALLFGFDEHSGILIDLSNGKVAGRITLADDETIVSAESVPGATSSAVRLLILTNESLFAYGITGRAGCSR